VVAQREAVGHAVRANYLYSGMADVTPYSGDSRYLPALTSIWTNVVSRKLHLTGGCGALAQGRVGIEVAPAQSMAFTLCLRLPGWVRGQPLPSDLYRYADATPAKWTLRLNGKRLAGAVTDGFVRLDRTWQAGDTVELSLPMPVRRVLGNERIGATRGLVALERGPHVYCFEGVDNEQSVAELVLPDDAKIKTTRQTILNGVVMLEVEGAKRREQNSKGSPMHKAVAARAIPYQLWDNRGLTPMRVWLARDFSSPLSN